MAEQNTAVAVQAESTEINAKGGQLDYMDGTALNKAYKNAMVLAKSDLVPDVYHNKPENVLLAIDMASRTGFSIMQVMQNLYIVKGKPSWSGSFCMNAIKACGKYDKVKYVFVGDPGTREYGCFVQAVDKATGSIVNGTCVNWEMVKAEGWDKKPGSKWITMPEQMFRYRAAAFFARAECPEVLQGIRDEYEQQDIYGYEQEQKQKTRVVLEDVVVDAEVE